MPNNESSNRLLRWYLFLLGVVASVASTLILFSPSEHPITSDNQIFFYRAERCASGRPPHTSIVDPRNSLPDLLTASAMVGGRRIGVSDLSASRLVSLSCHVLTAGLIAVFAFTISGSIRAGVLSVVIFLSLFATSRDAVVGNQTKAFVLLFLVAALLMYCRYRPFWAGVFSACSVLSWQPSVVMLLVLGALMWSHEDRWSRVRWFVAGAVLPALAYEGYFLIVGALSTQLEQSIVLPLLFMKGSFRGWVLSALHLVRVWQKGAGAYNLLIWVLFVASFIQTWIPVIQSPKRLTEFFRSRSCWAAIYVCAAVGLVFTYYDHQGFSDFYLVLPCIIVIAAATLDQLVRRLERVSVGLAWLALTLSMAAFLLPNLELMPRLQRDFTVSEQLEVANVVGQMIDSGESVWAIGCTHLLAFNQVDNWSAFGSCFRWSRAFVEYKTGKDRLSPEKDGSWPGVVLISRRFPYGSDVWLAQHYDEVTTKDFKRQGLQVFRLRSGSSVSKEDFSAPRKSPPAL